MLICCAPVLYKQVAAVAVQCRQPDIYHEDDHQYGKAKHISVWLLDGGADMTALKNLLSNARCGSFDIVVRSGQQLDAMIGRMMKVLGEQQGLKLMSHVSDSFIFNIRPKCNHLGFCFGLGWPIRLWNCGRYLAKISRCSADALICLCRQQVPLHACIARAWSDTSPRHHQKLSSFRHAALGPRFRIQLFHLDCDTLHSARHIRAAMLQTGEEPQDQYDSPNQSLPLVPQLLQSQAQHFSNGDRRKAATLHFAPKTLAFPIFSASTPAAPPVSDCRLQCQSAQQPTSKRFSLPMVIPPADVEFRITACPVNQSRGLSCSSRPVPRLYCWHQCGWARPQPGSNMKGG